MALSDTPRRVTWAERPRVARHPVYLGLARLRHPENVVGPDTELVIDGFMRMASTFALTAIWERQVGVPGALAIHRRFYASLPHREGIVVGDHGRVASGLAPKSALDAARAAAATRADVPDSRVARPAAERDARKDGLRSAYRSPRLAALRERAEAAHAAFSGRP